MAEVDALCAIADPESEPFRSRYAAAAALESLEESIARSLPDDALDTTDEDVRALVDVRAFVARRRGAVALDTEDWSAGETFLERARALLSRPAASASARRAPLIQTNNALGLLWCNRGDPERALPFLHAARDAYDAAADGAPRGSIPRRKPRARRRSSSSRKRTRASVAKKTPRPRVPHVSAARWSARAGLPPRIRRSGRKTPRNSPAFTSREPRGPRRGTASPPPSASSATRIRRGRPNTTYT